MNTKGCQLLDELAKIPGFDLEAVEADLDDVNHQWETANKVKYIADDHRRWTKNSQSFVISNSFTRIVTPAVYLRVFIY